MVTLATNTPNSRFQIHRLALAAPNKCAVCGSVGGDLDERMFIDIGMEQEFYGVVYYCTTCFTECANYLGYASEEQTAEFLIEQLALKDEIVRLENERDGLLTALKSIYDGKPGVGSRSESQELPQPVVAIAKSDKGFTEPKSKTNSTTAKQRPANVPDANGDSDTISLG